MRGGFLVGDLHVWVRRRSMNLEKWSSSKTTLGWIDGGLWLDMVWGVWEGGFGMVTYAGGWLMR